MFAFAVELSASSSISSVGGGQLSVPVRLVLLLLLLRIEGLVSRRVAVGLVVE